jgi:hypothetical protein
MQGTKLDKHLEDYRENEYSADNTSSTIYWNDSPTELLP